MNKNFAPEVFDEIDYEIILALGRDARMSPAKVAKELGINERTARRRIDRLIDTGALRISAVCEPSMFGYNSIVDVNITVEESLLEETCATIGAHPAVCYISHGLSTDEIIVQARFKSGNEISQFVNSFIRGLPGVTVVSHYFEASIMQNIDKWRPERRDFAKSSRITLKGDREENN